MLKVLITALLICGCGKDIKSAQSADGILKNNAGKFYSDGRRSDKWVALTFDDGPEPVASTEIVNVLKSKNAPASFFVLGVNARTYPRYVKIYSDNGYEVGNHTYSHKNFYRLKKNKNREELEKIVLKELMDSEKIISGIISRKPVFMRMPNGFVSPEVKKIAAENGYILVNWSFGCDWKRMTKEKLVKNYVSHAAPGAIFLLHEKKLTAQALPEIIDGIRNEGYEIVPLRQILPLDNPPQ